MNAKNKLFPDGKWKLPRPPIGRICTVTWTCSSDKDWGKGIWIIEAYEKMGSPGELITLRRSHDDKRMKITRFQADEGGIRVWRKDLIDPKFQPAIKNNKTG